MRRFAIIFLLMIPLSLSYAMQNYISDPGFNKPGWSFGSCVNQQGNICDQDTCQGYSSSATDGDNCMVMQDMENGAGMNQVVM